jgi:hypothetical protein
MLLLSPHSSSRRKRQGASRRGGEKRRPSRSFQTSTARSRRRCTTLSTHSSPPDQLSPSSSLNSSSSSSSTTRRLSFLDSSSSSTARQERLLPSPDRVDDNFNAFPTLDFLDHPLSFELHSSTTTNFFTKSSLLPLPALLRLLAPSHSLSHHCPSPILYPLPQLCHPPQDGTAGSDGRERGDLGGGP